MIKAIKTILQFVLKKSTYLYLFKIFTLLVLSTLNKGHNYVVNFLGNFVAILCIFFGYVMDATQIRYSFLHLTTVKIKSV